MSTHFASNLNWYLAQNLYSRIFIIFSSISFNAVIPNVRTENKTRENMRFSQTEKRRSQNKNIFLKREF